MHSDLMEIQTSFNIFVVLLRQYFKFANRYFNIKSATLSYKYVKHKLNKYS